MEAAAPGAGTGRGRARPLQARDEASLSVLRQYYLDHDVFLSSEGILKVISILGCIVAGALFLGSGGACAGGAPGLLPSGAGAALGAAAAAAALLLAVPLGLPLLAPQTFFYTDIIVTSVSGALLLLTGALTATVCAGGAPHYADAPLAMTMAATLMLSAGLTYNAGMRRGDAAFRAPPPAHPPRTHTHARDHDV